MVHIQFGTGTFDPLLELNYQLPLAKRFALGGFALGRFPVDENDKAYQGPVEVTAGLFLGHELNSRLFFHANGIFFYQGYAHWDGERDINSGLVVTSGMVGLSVRAGKNTNLGFDFLYPISQRTLSSEGDAFDRGPTILFGISRAFPARP